MGTLVNSPSEVEAGLTTTLYRDITITRRTLNLPSGALWVTFRYRLLPGATAIANQFAKIVINASSDSDADGKLAIDGAFVPLCQGDDLTVSAVDTSPIMRIDISAAEAVGSERTLMQILAGVKNG